MQTVGNISFYTEREIDKNLEALYIMFQGTLRTSSSFRTRRPTQDLNKDEIGGTEPRFSRWVHGGIWG